MIKMSFIFGSLLISLMNIHDVYILGGTALACIVLVVFLNMSHKIDKLKKEITDLKNK
jgi:hypothetical protein